MNETEVYEKSIEKWGIEAQMAMVAEEAAELAVAAMHMNRHSKNRTVSWQNFAEEIADVEFMIAEMKHYFPKLQTDVNIYKQFKMEKAIQRLKEDDKL